MTLSCGRVGPFMSSFSFDVSLMLGIVDLGVVVGGGGGGGGGGEKSTSEHAVNVSGRCLVARQESSALLGCRKKVFDNARQNNVVSGSCHDDAPWSAAWQCISKDFLREGKEISQSFRSALNKILLYNLFMDWLAKKLLRAQCLRKTYCWHTAIMSR